MDRVLKISNLVVIKFPMTLWKQIGDEVLLWNGPRSQGMRECNVRTVDEEGVHVYFKHITEPVVREISDFILEISSNYEISEEDKKVVYEIVDALV
ncbi:MAG: hypothetical protein ACXAE3_12740 [Candidatus Kariarchaeaceae archaeon]